MLNRIHGNKDKAAAKYVKRDFSEVVIPLMATWTLKQAGNHRHEFGSWALWRELQIISAPWRSRAEHRCVCVLSAAERERQEQQFVSVCVCVPAEHTSP